ncbi:MAG TPA: multicopper oxidase family protein [Longimicrobiales bacterium]|nr:multicopper oxidase family protein [Longimicrobiales bacterium]
MVDFCPSDPADFTPGSAPSTDLYCVELIARPDLFGRATGVVQLAPPPSPFGTAVTRDGRHRFRTTLFIDGLPDPRTLGAFTTYIAWAAPPNLAPLTKLGAVQNGRTVGGEVALNKFYLLVTAEPSDSVSDRTGPVVLRGLSPSTRMRDPHFIATGPPPDESGHDGHGASDGWSMPPHDARIPMSGMGIEHLTPDVSPFLPEATDSSAVPFARPREFLHVTDGDTIDLTAGLVRRSLKGRDILMYGFNGQYPGPLIQVSQASTITVDFHNSTPHETAVHWHGIRLDNRFDGVPHVTQDPVAPGESFRYTIHFPDAGIYWYHPHHREDIQQDLGLYGNLMVRPDAPDYYGPSHREEVLMLDDILLGENGLMPYGEEAANFAIMGRFGNVLLVNGEPRWSLDVRRGEVVRFHLTNASNTRTFNISFDAARMKVVASDVSRFEREEWVESVVLAPAERYVVDVQFERAGQSALTNRVQAIDHMAGAFFPMVDTLGSVDVSTAPATPDLSAAFSTLRRHDDVAADVERYREYFDDQPELDLQLMLEDRGLPFALTQLMRLDTLYFNPVEWAGTMPMMDWLPTSRTVRWVLRDVATGAENREISRQYRVGDVVRVRLRNERHSLHAMQHPIHIHGQRFLVLSVNGVPTENHVWKDTVLVPVGMSVELLLELSNPGRWMLHCHIAEHLEAGMQLLFDVDP